MDCSEIGARLKKIVFEKRVENGEKNIEAVREFLEDSIKLRCLPDAISAYFQPKELPRLAEILAKALEALDPYQVEIPTLIESLRERQNYRARRLAVFLKRCLA